MADQYYNNNKCLKGHQLQLKSTNYDDDDKDSFNFFFKCDGCKERGFGFRYCCDICKYDLHKECHRPSLTIQNQYPHFPPGGHTFFFLPNSSRRSSSKPPQYSRFCDACGKQILGFVYHCEDSGLYLHPCCNNLDPNITSPSIFEFHPSYMMPVGGIKSKSKACFLCNKTTYISGPAGTDKEVPGWSYVSTCEPHDWCHVYCMREFMMEIRRSKLLLTEKEIKNQQSAVRKWLSAANTATAALLETMTGITGSGSS